MKQEEAQLRLKKFHSKIFAKHTTKSSKEFIAGPSNVVAATDTDFDAFNVFRILSKEILKPSTPTGLVDAFLTRLKMNNA